MITKQDLKTLKDSVFPSSKILLEHLRVDHGLVPILEGLNTNDLLQNKINELTDELASLKSANPFYDINQQQVKKIQALFAGNEQKEKRIRVLYDEVSELTEEFNSLQVDYVELKRINQKLEQENSTLVGTVSYYIRGT